MSIRAVSLSSPSYDSAVIAMTQVVITTNIQFLKVIENAAIGWAEASSLIDQFFLIKKGECKTEVIQWRDNYEQILDSHQELLLANAMDEEAQLTFVELLSMRDPLFIQEATKKKSEETQWEQLYEQMTDLLQVAFSSNLSRVNKLFLDAQRMTVQEIIKSIDNEDARLCLEYIFQERRFQLDFVTDNDAIITKNLGVAHENLLKACTENHRQTRAIFELQLEKLRSAKNIAESREWIKTFRTSYELTSAPLEAVKRVFDRTVEFNSELRLRQSQLVKGVFGSLMQMNTRVDDRG